MLKVQEYLRSGKTLADLEKELAITNRITNGKISLSYDQCFSPMDNQIVQECRGLILEENTYNIIAFPFIKFFNYGEGFCPKINLEKSIIREKLDGSMLILYCYKEQWFFATRQMPEAQGQSQCNLTFSEIAFMTFKDMNIDFDILKEKLNKNYTYIFELTSPLTQVYIYYPNNKLTLLAVRDLQTLKELDPEPIAKELGLECPIKYSFNDFQSIVQTINSWKGTEQEGVVVCDSNFNRVKIKNLDYVHGQQLLHKMSASDRNVMVVVVNGNYDDLLSKAPSYVVDKINSFKDKLLKIKTICEYEYNKHKNIENMKEFALSVQNCFWAAYMFSMKRNKVKSFNDMIKSMITSNTGIDTLIDLCKKVGD